MLEMASVFTRKPGQNMGGHAVGIIVLNVGYPTIPGNVANASTFRFPVRYAVVEGSNIPKILSGDPGLLEPSLHAARQLVADGCRAIVGACGYWARFQKPMAASLEVPVFMSSLCQVPTITASLRPGEKLGVICASRPSLTPEVLQQVGVPPDAPLVVYGLEEEPEFRSAIVEGRGTLDSHQVESEVAGVARRMCSDHPEVASILLECSDIPPYAKAVQDATGRPVWDFITLINWIYDGVVKRRFEGFV